MYVEFLGIPRVRSGVAEAEVDGRTLGQVLGLLADRFPAFRECIRNGTLHSAFAANLNGDAFVSDPETALAEGDRLLILSADVGG